MNWEDYESVEPGVDRPLKEVSRKEARHAFTVAMSLKEGRKAAARYLLRQNGVELSADRPGLERLMNFLGREVSRDKEFPDDLDHNWHAMLYDLGLWLGDELISREPTLKWQLLTAPRSDVDYQCHVVKNNFMQCNPEGYLVGLSHLLVEDEEPMEPTEPFMLPNWFEIRLRNAGRKSYN